MRATRFDPLAYRSRKTLQVKIPGLLHSAVLSHSSPCSEDWRWKLEPKAIIDGWKREKRRSNRIGGWSNGVISQIPEGEDVTFPDPDLGPFRGRTERREGRKDGPLMQFTHSDSSHPNSVLEQFIDRSHFLTYTDLIAWLPQAIP